MQRLFDATHFTTKSSTLTYVIISLQMNLLIECRLSPSDHEALIISTVLSKTNIKFIFGSNSILSLKFVSANEVDQMPNQARLNSNKSRLYNQCLRLISFEFSKELPQK